MSIEETEARVKAATPELVLSLDGLWVWEMDGEDIKRVVGKFSRKEDAAAVLNARKGVPYLLAELGVAWEKLAAVEPLLRRLRTAHGDRCGICKTCCVPWPCMDAVAVDRILKRGK